MRFSMPFQDQDRARSFAGWPVVRFATNYLMSSQERIRAEIDRLPHGGP